MIKLFVEVRLVDAAGKQYGQLRRVSFELEDTRDPDIVGPHLPLVEIVRQPLMTKQEYLKARNLRDEGMHPLKIVEETGFPLQQINYAILCDTYDKYCENWKRHAS